MRARKLRAASHLLWTWALVWGLLAAASARAEAEEERGTFLSHPDDAPYWFSAQVNAITQAHPGFPADYSGPNSLKSTPEVTTSLLTTVFTGFQLGSRTEFVLAAESAAGKGLSSALGLAGFTNMDVVRNPSLGADPYVGRVWLRHIIPLTSATEEAGRNAVNLATRLPATRLEVVAGHMSTVDFFDLNGATGDSHFNFMNWTVLANGAYDYAADTRGYTYGAVVMFESPVVGVRFGEMLMPKVANGLELNWDLAHSRAENLEVALHHHLLGGRLGHVRLLGFLNHANMGVYQDAINAALAGEVATPDITSVRAPGRRKWGLGLNVEQPLTSSLGLFARVGWNNGKTESFAYTEVDDTVELGLSVDGAAWRRALDRAGVAFVSNGLSVDHRRYLELGGLGFILGDGALDYGRETIGEAYYNGHLWRGLYAALDAQFIVNPGYNQARGPVFVGSLRVHVEL